MRKVDIMNKKLKLILGAIIIGNTFFVGLFVGKSNIFFKDSNGETAILESIVDPMSIDLTDSSIRGLYDLYSKNDSLINILNNSNYIPEKLLKLAYTNPETIEFVSNYTNKVDNVNTSIDNDYVAGEIPLFLQWDERWGYSNYGNSPMAINGCAPTTLAMAIVGLTGDTSITPQVIANYSMDNNYYVDGIGTSWELISSGANYFGINSKHIHISEQSIISTLKKGNPIIISVKPGLFTTTGHFLMITALNEDGTVKINDPNSAINSSMNWDINILLKEIKGMWKISKS